MKFISFCWVLKMSLYYHCLKCIWICKHLVYCESVYCNFSFCCHIDLWSAYRTLSISCIICLKFTFILYQQRVLCAFVPISINILYMRTPRISFVEITLQNSLIHSAFTHIHTPTPLPYNTLSGKAQAYIRICVKAE